MFDISKLLRVMSKTYLTELRKSLCMYVAYLCWNKVEKLYDTKKGSFKNKKRQYTDNHETLESQIQDSSCN